MRRSQYILAPALVMLTIGAPRGGAQQQSQDQAPQQAPQQPMSLSPRSGEGKRFLQFSKNRVLLRPETAISKSRAVKSAFPH